MLKTKVIASHVTNLTDARYFAARGVDYLLFDLDDIAIDAAVEIKEWVEGPALLLLLSSTSTGKLDEAVLRLSPAYMGAKSADALADIAHLSTHVSIFKWKPTAITIEDDTFVPLTEDISLDDLPSGIIVRGGDEEEIGMKTFDDLDEFFDSIEIYN